MQSVHSTLGHVDDKSSIIFSSWSTSLDAVSVQLETFGLLKLDFDGMVWFFIWFMFDLIYLYSKFQPPTCLELVKKCTGPNLRDFGLALAQAEQYCFRKRSSSKQQFC